MGKDLYVRDITLEATEEELRRLFGVCGKVAHVHMVRDAKSGVFVGCAYVKMSSEAEAKDAIVSLDGALLIDRTIRVVAARPQKPKSRQGGRRPAPGGRNRPG